MHRTYRNPVYKESVPVKVRKGETTSVNHSFRVNSQHKQTAIGTLVANHYRV